MVRDQRPSRGFGATSSGFSQMKKSKPYQCRFSVPVRLEEFLARRVLHPRVAPDFVRALFYGAIFQGAHERVSHAAPAITCGDGDPIEPNQSRLKAEHHDANYRVPLEGGCDGEITALQLR